VDYYIKRFLFTYNYLIVLLLLDKSALKLVINVVNGF
jgi:hypothetical protein